MTAFFFCVGIGETASLFPGGTLKNVTRLPEILYNSTNPMKTSKLLKCFHFCVPYASDVQPVVRGLDVWGWDYFNNTATTIGGSQCHLWCHSRLSVQPHSVYSVYAPPRSCHQLACNIISLLCWWRSTLPKDQFIHFCCPVIFHIDYLSGGGKGVNERKCPAFDQLKDWSHFSRHPTPGSDICYFQHYLFCPKHSTLSITYQLWC